MKMRAFSLLNYNVFKNDLSALKYKEEANKK